MEETRKAFWDAVSVEEAAQAAYVAEAKALILCSRKSCKPQPEIEWLVKQKSLAKSPAAQRKQLERIVAVVQTLDYDSSQANADCVARTCPDKSRDFFEARKAFMIAQGKKSIAFNDLMQASKKAKKEQAAKKKTSDKPAAKPAKKKAAK